MIFVSLWKQRPCEERSSKSKSLIKSPRRLLHLKVCTSPLLKSFRVLWFLGGINYSNVMTKARKVQRLQKAGECGKETKGSGHQEKEGLWSLWGAPSSPCSSQLFTHSLKGNHHLTFLRFFKITFFTNRNMNETFRLPGYKTLYPQTNRTRSSEMNIAQDINNHFVGLVHSVRWSDGQMVRWSGRGSVSQSFWLF